MKNILYLHTGSNEGERLVFLDFARRRVKKKIGRIKAISSVYETSAWGNEDQPDYLNQALKVETILTPKKVLKAIKKIEKKSGRKRQTRWGARTLDIDILFYNNEILESTTLTIPHPRLHKRNFVLFPLSEIASNLQHPVLGLSIETLKENCDDDLEIWKYNHGKDEKF